MNRVKLFREWTESFMRGESKYDDLARQWFDKYKSENPDLKEYEIYNLYKDKFKEHILEKEFPNGLLDFSKERLLDIFNSFLSYYGDYDKALYEMYDHIGVFIQKYEKGGYIYRLIYVDSVDDINLDDMGKHWAVDDYIVNDLHDSGWKENFGKGEHGFVITLEVEPKNISIDNVDIEGNPEEKEVNVIDFDKTKLISVDPIKN